MGTLDGSTHPAHVVVIGGDHPPRHRAITDRQGIEDAVRARIDARTAALWFDGRDELARRAGRRPVETLEGHLRRVAAAHDLRFITFTDEDDGDLVSAGPYDEVRDVASLSTPPSRKRA